VALGQHLRLYFAVRPKLLQLCISCIIMSFIILIHQE
jgi:hypothetical protein